MLPRRLCGDAGVTPPRMRSLHAIFLSRTALGSGQPLVSKTAARAGITRVTSEGI
ncbi:hypothetical protein [[Phormidium] sp. ETS-05]|uniref:hypothetical protein n=1 Tax=[Phormidium] sp. ETS-05 TaxID=222819 RepID=UPI0018EF119C|nr:hypothetical protein [[Phormidium] sp. ETS-05]